MSTRGAVEGTEQLSHEDPCEGRVLEVQRLVPHDLSLFLDTGGKRMRAISLVYTEALSCGIMFLFPYTWKEEGGGEGW